MPPHAPSRSFPARSGLRSELAIAEAALRRWMNASYSETRAFANNRAQTLKVYGAKK
ncbi:hypothetical protein KCP71_24145 [Salmonella enterica subsp. enterica]|nr:hypothetical protein KCP71_24145 [Salmonella enterica subsp. enterica]